MKITAFADPRDAVATLVARSEGDTLAGVSRLLGRHPRYLDRFVREGVPKRLPEEDQRLLRRYLGGDLRDFGAPNVPTEAERRRWQPGARS